MSNNCFIPFKKEISDYVLPIKFPSPFVESPNALCKLAAKELQEYLENPIDWQYDFGLKQPEGSLRIGKMFGVLVVQNEAKELGYLAGFSGKLANKNHYQKFVPPIFDSLAEGSFLNVGMAQLKDINQRIKELENAPNWVIANQLFQQNKQLAQKEIADLKWEMNKTKIERANKRKAAKKAYTTDQFQALCLQLDQESTQERQVYKKLNKEWKFKLEKLGVEIKATQLEIQQLKKQRKRNSNNLQNQLFESYQFVNQSGEFRTLRAIFQDAKPISGAGECAAPKLLQYAFLHQLKPIALTEFWWGKSPKSANRKHVHFYPPCEEKCRPILGYMLKGL